MSTVAVVPARGGSKGIPRKNLADLGGRPLLQWTIDAATASGVVDRTIVTSDDDEILDLAAACGATPHRRPDELATDDVHAVHAVVEVLRSRELADGEVVMLLPTSPLRTPDDIAGAHGRFAAAAPPAVISVVRLDLHLHHLRLMDDAGALEALVPWDQATTQRQGKAPLFALNGSVYVSRADRLLRDGTFHVPGALGYEMAPSHSVDIDAPEDLERARRLVEERSA